MKTTIGNFTLQSSFPHDSELYDGMQDNLFLVSILGNVVGDKTILLGCEQTSLPNLYTDGYIFLRTQVHPEGEILYCESGELENGLYLKEEHTAIRLQDQEYPKAYTTRTLHAAGISSNEYNWEDFSRLVTTPELEERIKEHILKTAQDFALLEEMIEAGLAKAEENRLALEEEVNDKLSTLEENTAAELTSLETRINKELTTRTEEAKVKHAEIESKIEDEVQNLSEEVDKQLSELTQKAEEKHTALESKITTEVKGINDNYGPRVTKLEESVEKNHTEVTGLISSLEAKAEQEHEALQQKDTALETDLSKLKSDLANGSVIAKKADELTNPRKISLVGDATGNATFNGSSDISINASVNSSEQIVNKRDSKTKLSIWVGTEEDYNAISVKDASTIYHII